MSRFPLVLFSANTVLLESVVLAGIVSIVEFGQVAMQMLLTDVMVHTVNPAFQSSKVSLYSIRRDT